jgi:ankyrin repeat protein
MFPNPQSALPLPRRPSLERYRKIAKDLVKACKEAGELRSELSGADSVSAWAEAWAEQWIDALVRLSGIALETQIPASITSWIDGVAEFARRQLLGDAAGGRRCALADAQFVIARSHGFESWPKFVRGLEALAYGDGSRESRFEQAVDAIVSGDSATLQSLLHEEPGLARMRSMREHGATLLHYVSANGVEGYRQRTPKNVVEIAKLLLLAGAAVDATANVYGGGATTLGLAATSVHPERAEVQEDLLRLLLGHGARLDGSMVRACLRNGRGKAAAFLADAWIGASEQLDLVDAAGVGRLDLAEAFFTEDGKLLQNAALEQLQEAFLLACAFGHKDVAKFLLLEGAGIEEPGRDGQTALHLAVIGCHVETVTMLLPMRAPREARNRYGGTALEQALWSAAHGGDPDAFIALLEVLTRSGAKLPERHVPVNARIDAWLEERGSHAEPGWYWYGERPRSAGRQNLSS